MDFYRNIFFKESNIWLEEWLKSEIISMKLCNCIFSLRSFPPHISYAFPLSCPEKNKKTKQNKTNKQTNKQKTVTWSQVIAYGISWRCMTSVFKLLYSILSTCCFSLNEILACIYFHDILFNRKMGIQFCHLYVMVYGFSILLCFYSFVFKEDK